MKTDAQLHYDLMEALNWEPSLNATHIAEAERIATAAPGVIDVENHISVTP